MIPDWLITVTSIFLSILMLGCAVYITQLLVERFLISTLPILAELVNRIRNPNDYK